MNKERIEQIARELFETDGNMYAIRESIKQAVNESLEDAAREQDKRSTERHGYDKYGDAAVIRRMKNSLI